MLQGNLLQHEESRTFLYMDQKFNKKYNLRYFNNYRCFKREVENRTVLHGCLFIFIELETDISPSDN